MDQIWDIAIIGAGAAGLAAGIFAAETARNAGRALRIVVFDSARKIGAKILVSGGGRCNVTHDEIHPEDFNGSRNIVRNVLSAFNEHATIQWFASLGVPLKREETGKLFPVSDSARTVLDALLQRCTELKVAVLTSYRVLDVTSFDRSRPEDGFLIKHEHGVARARRVIMATGGRSLPRTGSDGSGWEIVRGLGHTVTETYPALVPLMLRDGIFHAELSGISLPVTLSSFADGKLIDRRTGSLLWTHFGVSGPVVMDASRYWIIAKASGKATELRCNFLPNYDFERLERHLLEIAAVRSRLSVGKALGDLLTDRLVTTLMRWSGIDPTTQLSQLPREQRRVLLRSLTDFSLPVERERGWNFAEVTAGGVPLHEIDYRTMASRTVPNLYLVGEMLDCDGRIGGFNFQWAWATGYVAGRAAATVSVKRHA